MITEDKDALIQELCEALCKQISHTAFMYLLISGDEKTRVVALESMKSEVMVKYATKDTKAVLEKASHPIVFPTT